jgi:hypothetical protein
MSKIGKSESRSSKSETNSNEQSSTSERNPKQNIQFGTLAKMTSLKNIVLAATAALSISLCFAILPGEPGPGDLTLSTGRIANVSARGLAGQGSTAMILGFVVSDSAKAIVVRAVGPSLSRFGITGAVARPGFRIYDSAGRAIWQSVDASDSAYQERLARAFSEVGAFPLVDGAPDAVVVTDLQPGAYTLAISNEDTGTGVVLAEVYEFRGDLIFRLPRVGTVPVQNG